MERKIEFDAEDVEFFGDVGSIGSPKLDNMMRGGIPRGFTILCIGEPGAGMDLFCKQFSSVAEDPENTVLISTGESQNEILQLFRRYSWPLDLRVRTLGEEFNRNVLERDLKASKFRLEGFTMAEIQSFVAESRQYGDTVKLCYRSHGHGDGLSLCEAAWELRDDADLSLALMGQGVGGDMPRIHAPMFSQSLVYATLETDFNLPDRGMINVRDLRIAWEMLGYSGDSEE